MSPKISIGSMPVCPTDCALMIVVTKARRTTTTATTGPSPSPMHTSSAGGNHKRKRPALEACPSRDGGGAHRCRRCRAVRARRWAGCPFKTTPRPSPIMRPMPRLETMPCVLTSQSPARAHDDAEVAHERPGKPERTARPRESHREHLRRVVERKSSPGMGSWSSMDGSSPARRGRRTTARQGPSSRNLRPVTPPVLVASSVSARRCRWGTQGRTRR